MMKSQIQQRTQGPGGQDRTFKDFIAVVLRGKWILLSALAVCLVAAALVTFLSEPVYQATCQVLLNARELQSSIFLETVRPLRGENITQNELTILSSNTLADSVAARVLRVRYIPGTHTLLPIVRSKHKGDPDSVASQGWISGAVGSAVDFEPVRESDVIRITARAAHPEEAALIANTYAEAYRDRNIYLSRSKTRSFRQFLEDQAAEKRRQLEVTEDSLKSYMEKQGIVSLDDESRKVIDQLAQLEATRDAAEVQLRQERNVLQAYQEQLPQQETNVARVMGEASDPYIRLLQEQLAKLEVQRDMVIAQNPSVVGREIVSQTTREIDAQISALRLKLQKRTDDFLRTLTPAQGTGVGDAAGYLGSVKQKIIEKGIEVQSLQEKKKAVEAVIGQYEAQFNRIPRKNLDLARLQRSRATNEKVYLMIEEKYNEANITEQSNAGYVEIIEPASVPFRPSSPKPLLNFAIGLVLGMIIGLGVIFTREYVDVRIHAPEDLKRRGLQPLASVVKMNGLGTPRDANDGKVPQAGDGDPRLVTLQLPFSPIAESFRQLRTNLSFSRGGAPAGILLVTSPAPGDGKSTTAANLAIAYAQAGKRVLLVDADLRKPALDRTFGAKHKPGLTEILRRTATLESVAQRTLVDKLFLIASGAIPGNAGELLSADVLREFLVEARSSYDVVIFDSSPLLAVSDPSVLATFADATLLVVAAGKTRSQEIEQSQDLLSNVGVKIAGVILNNFDPRRAYGFVYKKDKMNYYYGYGARKADSKSNGAAERAGSTHTT
jgi:capsular exopolysaccharide synthesis family protein